MKSKENVERKYKEILESLKSQRDELKLKLHLANMEVLEEWKVVEDKWESLIARGAQLEKEVGGAAHELGDTAGKIGQEIKNSYKRIRKLIDDNKL
ncbi:MAG: hypothetical protein HKN85_01930 [Gammaproteobacteria bacterium]|nr:hypothetical protein [Gammaproteobacteria bacterium]